MEKILLKLYILPVPISTHPREGTKTSNTKPPPNTGRKFQLTPARGRKRSSVHSKIYGPDNFNSPPRGDENSSVSLSMVIMPYFNSPPRGDENIEDSPVLADKPNFNSPPRGDENVVIAIQRKFSAFQLTPARGRKRYADTCQCGAEISTHPREGTKTRYARARMGGRGISTHPREGTKTEPRGGAAPRHDFNSPPRGDENHKIKQLN